MPTANNIMHPAPGQEKALALMDSLPALSDGPGKSQGSRLIFLCVLFYA